MPTLKSYTVYLLAALLPALALPSSAYAQSTAEKEQIANAVYSNIAQAMGLIDRPPLVLDRFGNSSVASVDFQNHRVIMEEKAFDLCASFGNRRDDALAFILGHELAHYRFDHNWGESFRSSYALADVVQDVGKASDVLAQLPYWEAQADQMGGIFAFLAGYDPTDIAEDILDKVYHAYGLDHHMHGYPTLGDRKHIASQNGTRLAKLITVYETGNYALMAGQYNYAVECYEHVVRNGFTSREVLNNQGVAFAMMAMEALGADKVRFAYPLELDISSRVRGTRKAEWDPEILLRQAYARFQQAAWVDPEYATAWLNLGCVASLQQQYEEATFYARKAELLGASSGTASGARVLQGIVLAMQKKNSEAEKIWQAESKKDNYLASQNLAILKGKDITNLEWKQPESTLSMADRPSMDGIDLSQPNFNFAFDAINMGSRNLFITTELPASTLIFYQVKDTKGMLFHRTEPNYTGAAMKGLKSGSTADQARKTLGEPAKVIATGQGFLLQYPTVKTVLQFDRNNRLTSWMTYQET